MPFEIANWSGHQSLGGAVRGGAEGESRLGLMGDWRRRVNEEVRQHSKEWGLDTTIHGFSQFSFSEFMAQAVTQEGAEKLWRRVHRGDGPSALSLPGTAAPPSKAPVNVNVTIHQEIDMADDPDRVRVLTIEGIREAMSRPITTNGVGSVIHAG